MVRNLADTPGNISHTRQTLSPILGAVRGQLIGWCPDSATKPLTLSAGQVLDFNKGVLVWIDSYQVTHVIGSSHPQRRALT
ncbi:hypothetical protein ACF1CY_000733 [Providencia rettgeri]